MGYNFSRFTLSQSSRFSHVFCCRRGLASFAIGPRFRAVDSGREGEGEGGLKQTTTVTALKNSANELLNKIAREKM